MLASFSFTLARLRCLRVLMEGVPSFHPDGKDLAYVSAQVALAEEAEREFLGVFNAFNVATAALREEVRSAHEAAVLVAACMKSCYRKDGMCSAAIARVPNHDRSAVATLRRLQGLAACWSTLPDVPGTSSPFSAGPWTQSTFAAKAAGLEGWLRAADVARSVYFAAQASVRVRGREWNDLVAAALTQGRALFAPGSQERACLDRVPRSSRQQLPAQAVISVATSPAAGAVHLEFAAAHGTWFEVWHRGPGAGEFALVAVVERPGVYDAAGVSGGPNVYEVVGGNSRGTGPASAPVSVEVSVAAPAAAA